MCRYFFGLIILVTVSVASAAGNNRVIFPKESHQEWRYTFDQPAASWLDPAFDDSAWDIGQAPFGGQGRTLWNTNSIWLRCTFDLTSATLPRNPALNVFHDEDVWIYMNGKLVAQRPGFTTKHKQLPILPNAFVPGRNVIAAQCIQTTGGQAIDIGLVDVPRHSLPSRTATITIDLKTTAGPPLSKTKFNVYNCPYFTTARWFRDLHLLYELGCDSLRYDITWGGHNVGIDMNSPQISGTAENPIYNFQDFDRFTDSLLHRNIKPMYVLAYTPEPLQKTRSIWAEPPADMNAWRRVCRDFAAHWRSTRRKVPYYEIWNEPDNPPFFFKGTREDYFEIYRHGASGVKEADPDAFVGGPVVAALEHDDSWLCAFAEFVTSNSLPLDFLSFHNYADPIPIIRKARECLRKYTQLENVPMMLTEYNSFAPLTPDFDEGGAAEEHIAAARLLHDFKMLLEEPGLERVYWAMFNDPDTQERCGLVSLDGHRKAAYNAFSLYMKMPTERVHVDSSTTEVEVLAAADGHHVGFLIWNIGQCDYEVTAQIAGVSSSTPFRAARIDPSSGSWGNDPNSELPDFEKVKITSDWNFTIAPGSVIALTSYPE